VDEFNCRALAVSPRQLPVTSWPPDRTACNRIWRATPLRTCDISPAAPRDSGRRIAGARCRAGSCCASSLVSCRISNGVALACAGARRSPTLFSS